MQGDLFMKTNRYYLFVLLLLFSTVLIGCEYNGPYKGNEVTQIYYCLQGSEWPVKYEKSYDFTNLTYSTKTCDDPYSHYKEDFIEHEFEIVATFTKEEADNFLKKISNHGIYNLKEDYQPFAMITDGSSWRLIITFSDGTTFNSGGYMKSPSQATTINKDSQDFIGVDLFTIYRNY